MPENEVSDDVAVVLRMVGAQMDILLDLFNGLHNPELENSVVRLVCEKADALISQVKVCQRFNPGLRVWSCVSLPDKPLMLIRDNFQGSKFIEE